MSLQFVAFNIVPSQAQKEHGVEDPYYCLSDFVAPLDTNVKDYIGCFAVSVMGAEDMAKKYVKQCFGVSPHYQTLRRELSDFFCLSKFESERAFSWHSDLIE